MMQSRYLPNLNGLRAISAILVILGHATSLQLYFGGYQFKDWLWIPTKFGVVIFFCISGILISYLLDIERKETGTINIKQFWIRRAARIWPLYFLVVIPAIPLNLAISNPNIHVPMNFLDYTLMALILPGFADRPMFVGPTWSIGIEESFYVIYPLMLCFLSRRNLIVALFAIAVSPEIFSFIGQYTCPSALCTPRLWWSPEWYGCIAIGCLFYYAYGNERLRTVIFSPAMQCFAFSAIAAATAVAVFAERFLSYRLAAILFSVVIINGAFNPKSILQIENRLTRWIGEISYGLYMYQVYGICLALMICWIFFKGPTFPYQNLIVSSLSLIFTVVMAKLSYDYIERPIREWARRTKTTTLIHAKGAPAHVG